MPSVEYLTITEKTNTFCDSIATFNNLLQVDSSLIISGGQISYQNNFNCDYKITSGEILAKEQRYFHTYFSIASETEADLLLFSEFLKTVRTILSKVGSPPETLWDDISFHYSRLAYNVIHRTENLMRKLITNFMLVTVGIQWVNETTPQEVKDVISKGKRKDYINVLHNVDFIHLADFLLKPYSNTPHAEIVKKIKSANSLEDIENLQALLPESNWNKYFSTIVNCEDTFLQRRWGDLYELRCKVAHNAIISRFDYEQISLLVSELEQKLLDALEKLPQVKVPETDVSTITDNAATTASTVVGEFISAFRILERHLSKKANELGFASRGALNAARYLMTAGVITEHQQISLRTVINMRNNIVHSTDISNSDFEINDAILLILDLIDSFGFDSGSET